MIDTSNIPKPEGKTKFVKRAGNTKDIITSILNLDSYQDRQFCKFAKQFEGRKGLKRLWSFVKYEIDYKKDSFEESLQLTPPALWKRKTGDCKSKTLFINAVLRCLNIPYVTRFTNYTKGEKDIKHVYTVAIIEGKEVPIDTVYNVFGKEKIYNLKKDYMPKIMEISGFERSAKVVQKKCNEKLEYDQAAVKRMEEIIQKKQYVKEQEIISFSKISEGTASLKILERQMVILETMLPERKKEVLTGLKLIRKALKGDYSCAGLIPKTLAGTVATIKNAEKWSKVAANSFGGSQIKIDKLEKERQKCRIGSFPERVCLSYEMWREAELTATNPSVRIAKQYLPQKYDINRNYQGWGGVCAPNDLTVFGEIDFEVATIPTMWGDAKNFHANGDNWTWGEIVTYAYGRNSKYFKNYNQVGDQVLAELRKLDTEGIVHGLSYKEFSHGKVGEYGNWSCDINSQTDYELTMERLNNSSGVLDAYINGIFRADVTNQNGTLGSAFLYTFHDGTNVNPNDFPFTVISKAGFQDQFLDATNYFSNISRSSVKGLARNGILYDMGGEQPEYTLEELVKIFKSGSSINYPGVAETITLIIMIVGFVVGVITQIVEQIRLGEAQAAAIDLAKKDLSRFNPLGPGKLTSPNDWIPGGGNGNGNNDDEDDKNMLLLAGAGLLGAAALMGSGEKKNK